MKKPLVYETRIVNGWDEIGLWDANGELVFGQGAGWDCGATLPSDEEGRLLAAAYNAFKATS